MEALTTAEAAELAGVTVRQWHYWTEKLNIQPDRQLAGRRGSKLWNRLAVRMVVEGLAEKQSAA